MKKQRIAALLLALVLCLGLLPMAAMAEGEHTESYTIAFDANGGAFPDGSKTWTTTTKWLGAGNNITDNPPEPTRDGFLFAGWDAGSGASIGNVDFTANTTVKATWTLNPNLKIELTLDPSGGVCAAKTVTVDISGTAPALAEELPIPTREGYDFQGWFRSGSNTPVKKGDVFTAPETLTAKWTKTGAQDPVRVDFIPNGGTIESIRGVSSDKLIPGMTDTDTFVDQNSGIGMMMTGDSGRLDSFPVIKREGYTLDGWYIVGESVLDNAHAGKEVDIPASAKKADLSTVFKASALLAAKWTEAGSKNGPFTVKFDLNYKNPKQAEIPKDKTVVKGDTVGLPNGSKLTPPAINLEFYAWCIQGKDGKLYPWKETNPVTGDMTLYASWVRKGTVVKDGQAVPEATEPSKPTENPEVTVITDFHDVPANSPFLDSIVWAVKQGITNGKTATTFGPGDPCTRAQIVTFLWRAAGSPEPKNLEAEYADVTNTAAYYYKAIQWAAEMGMEESGTFAPDNPCTRGQAMYFIWKARAGASSAGSAPSFTDLSRDSLYYDAVLWAVGQGVTNGTGDGTTFSPDNPCTRGQIVTFLYRAYET